MIAGGGTSGGGADPGIGPQLEKLRRENSLADTVHDPGEDEPHIVRLPAARAEPTVVTMPRTRHNWLAIAFVVLVILAGMLAVFVTTGVVPLRAGG